MAKMSRQPTPLGGTVWLALVRATRARYVYSNHRVKNSVPERLQNPRSGIAAYFAYPINSEAVIAAVTSAYTTKTGDLTGSQK